MKHASLRGNPNPEDSVSVEQFKITSEIKDQPYQRPLHHRLLATLAQYQQ
jgi:hypothetical protein